MKLLKTLKINQRNGSGGAYKKIGKGALAQGAAWNRGRNGSLRQSLECNGGGGDRTGPIWGLGDGGTAEGEFFAF